MISRLKKDDQKNVNIVKLEDLVEVLSDDYFHLKIKLEEKGYIIKTKFDAYKGEYILK